VELDRSAVSYNKGCYLGQEGLSRLRSIGHVNRLLCQLRAAAGGLPPLPADCEAGGKSIGRATSGAIDPASGEVVALAVLPRQFAGGGVQVRIGGTGFTVGGQDLC
jgi:folate-binding Fe-S cluster repair protein YgfZ